MTGQASTPGGARGYDVVTIREEDGRQRSLSRNEYEKLPLAERIRLVLQGRVEFFLAGSRVPPNVALKVTAAG